MKFPSSNIYRNESTDDEDYLENRLNVLDDEITQMYREKIDLIELIKNK